MRIRTFKCDVCEKQRISDSNHWFVVTVSDSQPSNLIVEHWQAATAEAIDHATFHLCGQEHLVQKVAEWAAQP